MLPLGNACILDYTLYWLASQRVDEVLICCTCFYDEIAEYIKKTNWNVVHVYGFVQPLLCRHQNQGGRMQILHPTIQLLAMAECYSTGDVLRAIDNMGIIESPSFLVMNAGTVTNIDLNAIWRDFDKRYKESTYNVMTSVFTHIPCESGKKTEQDLVMVLNEESRILAYGQLLNNEPFSILTSSALSNHRVAARHETHG